MMKTIMRQTSFKQELFTALKDLEVFGAVSVDAETLNTTRSHICIWNKNNPEGPNYKVLRIGDHIQVLRVK